MELNELRQQLEERGALQPCPRCGKNKFLFNMKRMNVPMDNEKGVYNLMYYAPCVAVICKNCGAISLHAISILDGTDHIE